MPTTVPPAAATATAAPPAARTTRLGLAGENGQTIVELSAAPQTIGSGPRCSVRLSAAGLRPLHCVITPTDNGPVVRRWAVETLLNGAEFNESPLVAGDQLGIGSVNLLVVDLAAPEAERPQPDSEPTALETIDELEYLVGEESTAGASAAAAADETPTNAPAEWVDDSVELLEQRHADPAQASEPAPDPAIPSRLLKPWVAPSVAAREPIVDELTDEITEETKVILDAEVSAAENGWVEPAECADTPTDPASPCDADFSDVAGVEASEIEPVEIEVVEVNDTESKVDEVSVDEVSVDEVDDPWRVEFADTDTSVTDPTDEAHPTENAAAELAADDPWRVDGALAAVVEEAPVVDAAAAKAFEASAAPAAPTPAADDEALARLRGRLAANRTRVTRLAEALRTQRERVGQLDATIADRDARIGELQDRLDHAMAAANDACDSLTRLSDEAASTGAALAAASEAAERAAARADVLEARVQELESLLAERDGRLTAYADEVPAVIEPTEPDDEVDPWSIGSPDAVVVEVDESCAAIAPTVEQQVDNERDAADVELWGIERLATETEPAATETAAIEPDALLPEAVHPGVDESAPRDDSAETQHEPWPTASAELDLNSVPARDAEVAPSDTDYCHAAEGVADERSEPSVEIEYAAELEPAPEPEPYEEQSHHAYETEEAEYEEEPQTASVTEPESFIERYSHLVPDDDAPVEPVSSLAETTPGEVASPVAAASSDDDDSIDDYMRKLMERMRGGADPAPAKPQKAESTPAVAPKVAEVAAAPEPTPESLQPMRDLSEMRRNTAAPRVTTDLGALRQLANQSARQAIGVAETRQSREKATLRLTVSAVALVFGALAAVTAVSPFDLQFAGGFASVLGGGWFGLRTLRSCQAAARADELEAVANGKSIA